MDLDVEQLKSLRRTAIALARRRQRRGTGSSQNFLTGRTANRQWYDLRTVLEKVSWAVVGAVATRHYMPERMTKDLDVIVTASNSTLARKLLQTAGLTYQGELSIGRSLWLTPDGQEIDLLEGKESWLPTGLEEAKSNRDLHGLPILPLPYLALMKFKASRLQDIADLSRMLGQSNPERLEQVRRIFQQYTGPDDLEDLENIIALGQLEGGSTPV